jgi:hypothetical protein
MDEKTTPTMGERIRAEAAEVLNAALRWRTGLVEEVLSKRKGEAHPRPSFVDREDSYQAWYSKAIRLIAHLAPERLEEFTEQYRAKRPTKEIQYSSYTLADFLAGVRASPMRPFEVLDAAVFRVTRQIAILTAAVELVESAIADIRGVLEASLFDNELAQGSDLIGRGYLRAGIVLAGVVLEGHLRRLAQNHRVTLRKTKPTLGDLNENLKEAAVYDLAVYRRIQAMGDVRNLGAHKLEREPTQDEARWLVGEVDRLIKTVH